MDSARRSNSTRHRWNASNFWPKLGPANLIAAANRATLELQDARNAPKRIFRGAVVMFSCLVAATSLAIAQSPKITSVSKVSAQQYQTIVITGNGFGTQQPYTGDSPYISFNDFTRSWQGGYPGNTVTLVVNSWEDSQIVLGGFSGAFSQFGLGIGDHIGVYVWNPQSGIGPAHRNGKVTALPTTVELTSSPNPSADGQAVTFTAEVAASGGAPPDGEPVSFMAGTTVLGTGTLSDGSATFVTSTLPVGKTTVKAVYGGDADFKGSKSVKQVVQ
jgi:hypothetical protein